jgi:CheY-like chemotaxis protein
MTDTRPRLLLLEGGSSDRSAVSDALGHVFDVVRMTDFEEALSVMREQHIDAVFADVGDFLPLERGLASGHAALVLNTLAEGVCICNVDGEIAWQNDRFANYSDEARRSIIEACTSSMRAFNNQLSAHGTDPAAISGMGSRRVTAQGLGDTYFEVAVSPVINRWREGEMQVRQVVAITSDMTASRRLQRKIDAIDAAGAELVRIEAEAVKNHNAAERLRLLENKIMRYTRELLNFDHFSIRLLNRATNKLELVIAVGLAPEAMDLDLFAETDGNGISGYTAATGRSYICYDVRKDPRYVAGLNNARSSLTVPLRLYDSVIGIFNIESEQVGAFDEDDRQFAEIFARYMAMALNILDLLVVERYTTNEAMAERIIDSIKNPLTGVTHQLREFRRDHDGQESLTGELDDVLRQLDLIRRKVGTVARGPRTILDAEEALGRIEKDTLFAGKRILVAEDEEEVREQAQKVLQALGCTVLTAANGQAAIDALRAASGVERFDLVLSDIKLPDRNGYEVFSAARKHREETPVILMTGFGYDPHHSIVRASQEGLQCVLFKPFQADQLLSEVRRAFSPDAPQEG